MGFFLLGTVNPMSTPQHGPVLHLPDDPDDLIDFAFDLRGFTVANVAKRVGVRAVVALEREDPIPARIATEGGDQVALLTRLFLLGCSLSEDEIHQALPHSWAQAQQWGIITTTNPARANIDLRPTTVGEDNVWLAADLGEIATQSVLPTDHVLGLGGASATLVRLTVRNPVERALDLGAGAGIQTLGLAHHATTVVATDISPRALAFAAFNLALNDALNRQADRPSDLVQRVELVAGSFFEPVEGTFDLIVSNPPFVVGPQNKTLGQYTYRDGGFEGDGVVSYLVENLPTYLRPGGVAQLLANWEIYADQEWDERIHAWVDNLGVDAWVIMRERVDPAHYVHTWMRDGGLTPDRDAEAYEKAYRAWLADFDDRGVKEIAFGYVILRRPKTTRPPWIRCEEITGTVSDSLGETVTYTLDMVEKLSHTSDEDLLTWHLEVGSDVTEERYHHPGQRDPSVIIARQGGGFGRSQQLDTIGAAVVGACDGQLDVGTICQAVAHVMEANVEDVTREVLHTLRPAIIDGLVRPSGQESDTLNQ